MRIILAHDNLGDYGGAEISLKLTEKLLKNRGHKVQLFGSEAGEDFRSLFTRWYSPSYYCQMRSLIKTFQPDLLHVNSVSRVISPSVIVAAFRQNVPVVMTVRDAHLICGKAWAVTRVGSVCPGFSLKCLWRCRNSRSLLFSLPYDFIRLGKVSLHRKIISAHCSHYIAPSKQLRSLIKREFLLSDQQVSWVPNCIGFDQSETPQFDSLDPKRMLYVGRLSKEKGIGVAIRAVAELIHQDGFSDLQFDIVGSGPAGKELKKLVGKLTVAENINFVGQLPNAELGDYYKKAGVVIMPSIWLENNPRVALEAMKFGRPIIASSLGGYPDLITDGQNGFLFPAGDVETLKEKIKTLYNDKSLAVFLGGEGFRKLCAEFSAESHYQRLMRVYSSIKG